MMNVIGSTTNTTPPKSTKSQHSNSSVHIQIRPKFQFELIPQHIYQGIWLIFFLFFFPRLDRYRKWKHPNTSRKPGYFFFLYRETSRNPDIFFFNTTSHQGIWAIIPFILYHKTTRNLGFFFFFYTTGHHGIWAVLFGLGGYRWGK